MHALWISWLGTNLKIWSNSTAKGVYRVKNKHFHSISTLFVCKDTDFVANMM